MDADPITATGGDDEPGHRAQPASITPDDRSPRELDDELDRDELRRRYYGLLQELRVLLPGTQVLVAFLFTVPFNDRFTAVDRFGQQLFGLALGAGVLAIVSFIAPTAFHRLGHRRTRSARLRWSIGLLRVGLVLLATSLVASLAVVLRFVFGPGTALVGVAIVSTSLVLLWLLLPQVATPPTHPPQ
jgi:hypothetical protein